MIRVRASATSAAVKNAVRTVLAARGIVSMGLRTARTYRSPPDLKGTAARAYSVPSIEPKVYCARPPRNAPGTSTKRSDSRRDPSAAGDSSS